MVGSSAKVELGRRFARWALGLSIGTLIAGAGILGYRLWVSGHSTHGVILSADYRQTIAPIDNPVTATATKIGLEEPLAVAVHLSNPDQRIVQWLNQWAAYPKDTHANNQRDERDIDELDDILSRTSLRASDLAAIAMVFPHVKDAVGWAVTRRFIMAAEEKAESDLASAQLSTDTKPLRQLLWNILPQLQNHFEWIDAGRIYRILTKYEPEGSDRRYRARLKFADMCLESNDAIQGLHCLDELIADVERDTYSTANPKDIAKLKWALSLQAAQTADGLKYLRAALVKNRGGTYENPIHETLIAALLDTRNLAQAEREFALWSVKYDVKAEARATMAGEIAELEWRELHRRDQATK